jgi:hypothetical protein
VRCNTRIKVRLLAERQQNRDSILGRDGYFFLNHSVQIGSESHPASFPINFNPLKTKRVYFVQGLSAYRAVNTLHFGYKNQSLNFYKAKVAVCSAIRTKHRNAMWAPRRIF